MKFYRVTELLKASQFDIPDYQEWLGCNAKKIGPPNSPRKIRISMGNIDLFAYYIFKNSEILSCQGFAESKPI